MTISLFFSPICAIDQVNSKTLWYNIVAASVAEMFTKRGGKFCVYLRISRWMDTCKIVKTERQ